MDNNRILLIEDSMFFGSIIVRRLENDLGLDVTWEKNLADAQMLLENDTNFALALLDVTLPDAPQGEVISYVLDKEIPSIIFTGGFDGKFSKTLQSQFVVDYLLKDSTGSVETLITTVQRFLTNDQTKILIVEDSGTSRRFITNMLSQHRYTCIEASNGVEGLERLKEHPDTSLIITDYNMPEMDGFELVKAVRKNYPKEEMSIIGISAQGNNILSAQFIKNGANDFLLKPFLAEELYCRVVHNLEIIGYIRKVREMSIMDELTKLYNRRHFFELGSSMIQKAKKDNHEVTLAMLDIDHFKNFNDTYGHAAGDEVLKHVSGILRAGASTHGFAARLGGEEFCVMIPHGRGEDMCTYFDGLRRSIEVSPCLSAVEDRPLSVTTSIGLCACEGCGLENMLKVADERLYKAKEGGRNRVVNQ